MKKIIFGADEDSSTVQTRAILGLKEIIAKAIGKSMWILFAILFLALLALAYAARNSEASADPRFLALIAGLGLYNGKSAPHVSEILRSSLCLPSEIFSWCARTGFAFSRNPVDEPSLLRFTALIL